MIEWTPRLICLLTGVGLFTAAAALWDLKYRRIPNKLTLPAFLIGLVYQAVFMGWAGLGDAGLGFLAGFGTLFVLWIVGGGGGGDVKLMGALSVWLGFKLTLYVMIASTLIVIAVTAGTILWSAVSSGFNRTRSRFLAPADSGRAGETVADRQRRRVMAYAVPVALATWFVLALKLPTL